MNKCSVIIMYSGVQDNSIRAFVFADKGVNKSTNLYCSAKCVYNPFHTYLLVGFDLVGQCLAKTTLLKSVRLTRIIGTVVI